MSHSKIARLAGLLAPAVLVACQLSAGAPTSTPSASARPTVTTTLAPTGTVPPSPTFTASATFTPAPTATQTPTPDPLAGAVLKLTDLPDGFVALTEADRARLGFSDETLAKGYAQAFSADQLHNAAGFIAVTEPNYQVALAYLFYPLSPLQQAATDLSLANPAVFIKAFVTGAGAAGAPAGSKITAQPLAGMNQFGDKSVGVAGIITSPDGLKVHLDVVVVRRGNVFEVYNSVYPNGSRPPAALADMVAAVDARVAAVGPAP